SAETNRGGFNGPTGRATCEHSLARCTDEFEETRVCVETILSVRALNRHRHRAGVKRFRKTLLRATKRFVGRSAFRYFAGQARVGGAQFRRALVYERIQFLHLF